MAARRRQPRHMSTSRIQLVFDLVLRLMADLFRLCMSYTATGRAFLSWMSDKGKKSPSAAMGILPVVIFAIALPLSMLMWVGNITLNFFTKDDTADPVYIPPTRWLSAMILPILFTGWGVHRKSLSKSGAVLALLVGFILTLSSYMFVASMLMFFFSSSKATKFRSHQKRKLEEDFKEGGQRNWIQVLCNGGMAAQLGLLYMLDCGCGERPVDFVTDYRSSWLSMGVLGALACCNGDTWASELGAVLGSGQPFLITTWRRVPKGTNGGVSFIGIVVSLLGGLFVGVTYYLTVLYAVDGTVLAVSPPQWPVIVAGAFGGLVGSLVDSLLGATLQYSGLDSRTSCVVEHSGKGISHICGVKLLDNHSVNLLSSIIMGLLTPRLANLLWP